LLSKTLEQRFLLATVTFQDPLANSQDAPVTTNVSATYDEPINAGTATPQNFVVRSHMSPNMATISVTGNTITADPANDFFAGEQVQVTSTEGIQGTTAGVRRVWQFRGDGADSDRDRLSGDFQQRDRYRGPESVR
jgi:hypothetical protein